MLWLLLAPLVPGLLWCLWVFWKERELRLVLVAGFLAAMLVRQLANAPPAGAGFGELALQQQLAPVLLDLAANILALLAAIAIGRSIVERNRAEQVHWNAMEAFRSLARVFNSERDSFEEALDDLLSLGSAHLGAEIGLLSRIDGEDYEIRALSGPEDLPIAPGDRLTLSQTFCSQTVGRDQLLAIEDTGAGAWAEHAARGRLGFASYFGAPVRIGDRIVGTLCFAGTEARRHRFSGSEKQLLDMMAHWVGSGLAKREAWEGLGELARRQQTSLELSRHALDATGADLLQESVSRIASALDVPYVAVLETKPRSNENGASENGGDDELSITAGVGWRAGTLESRVAISNTLLEPALSKGETVAIADLGVGQHGQQPAFFEAHEIAATACVPIIGAEQQIGVLCVAAVEAREFRQDELDFLRLSTNLIASARGAQASGDVAESSSDNERQRSESAAAPPAERRGARRDNAPDRRRVAVDAAVSELEPALRAALGSNLALELDLSAASSEVRMFRYEFERVLWGLVLRVAELASDPANLESSADSADPTDSASLRIETRRLGAGEAGSRSADFVTLGVTASGTKLDNAAMSKLLDSEEAPSARTREAPTGMRRLPLPRIRRLLRAVGGDISAHSGERDGTTLTSYLPARSLRSQSDAPGRGIARQTSHASS